MRFRNPFKKREDPYKRLMKEVEQAHTEGTEKARGMMLDFIIPMLESVELYHKPEADGPEKLLTAEDLPNFTNDQLWEIMLLIQVELEK